MRSPKAALNSGDSGAMSSNSIVDKLYGVATLSKSTKENMDKRRTAKSGRWLTHLALCVLTVCLMSGLAGAQSSSGTISGRVVDQSGAVVAGANVDLVNQTTGVKVSTQSRSNGDFNFIDVLPGTFRVIVRANGFKELRQENLVLTASSRLSAGTLKLHVGSVAETVNVEADVTPIQLTSAERSGTIDSKQLDNLLTSGRDPIALIHLMPGVVGGSGSNTPTVNGVRNVYNSASVDGITGSVREGRTDTIPNIDTIAEVKVLASNYQAEYGKQTGGAVINIITKSGTSQFHGALYYYMQNEALNANDWFNNYNGSKRPKSRKNTVGGNIGGPIYWPGHFNTGKNKLFFFYSQEFLPNKRAYGLAKYTVPTALERVGDFSQSYAQGKINPTADDLINIKKPGAAYTTCPVTGTAGDHSGCYNSTNDPSTNKIPAGLINPSIQAMLNLMPLPDPALVANRTVTGGNYNYTTNYTGDAGSQQEVFRVDYNPTEKLHMFFRGQLQSNNNDGYGSTVNGLPWLIPGNYRTTNPNFAFNTTYTFTPTIVNELVVGTAGWSENQIYSAANIDKIKKETVGYAYGQLFPKNNPLDLVPAATFGGVSNAAIYKYDARFPMHNQVRLYSITDTFTKVWGNHIIKAGVDLQTDAYLQSFSSGGAGTPAGAFDFGRNNTTNPNDSNYAYSNALMGNFNSYKEPTERFDYDPRSNVSDWYVQDQWKANRNLTLDYGLRFTYSRGLGLKTGANFVPSLYDAGKAPVLYQPKAITDPVTHKKITVAIDPTTSTQYPGAYVGLFVPNTGDLSNGAIKVNTPGYPKGMVNGNGVLVAPRLGFAYDPFGQGKTVIRGGWGLFYNAETLMGQAGDMTFNPPNIFGVEQFYGNVSSFTDAGSLLGPSNVGHAIDLNAKQTSVMNMSLGVQQQMGAGVVLDVAYVGTLGRHLSGEKDINEVPYGAHFDPANKNPAGGVLPDNFFRPYPGYGSIGYQTDFLTSSYHALQAQLTRRFRNGLEFGVAYTWSKSMDYADSYNGKVSMYRDIRTWDYGPGGDDRRNNFIANYLYSLPKGSRVWSNFATKAVLDNWQISGIVSYLSGAPDTITFSTVDGADLDGGGDGTRVYLTGNPMEGAPHTFGEYFNTSVVQRPSQGTLTQRSNGNAPKVTLYNPGVFNMDTALFKNFPIHNRVAVQIRAETYNTLNHPEFNGFDSAAKFSKPDASGNSTQTNSTFGQLNDSAGPRTMQLALRINF